MTQDVAAVVLAAGLGTRMKSDRPKVLHELGGRPLLLWAVDTAQQAVAGGRVVVIIGEEARQAAGNSWAGRLPLPSSPNGWGPPMPRCRRARRSPGQF